MACLRRCAPLHDKHDIEDVSPHDVQVMVVQNVTSVALKTDETGFDVAGSAEDSVAPTRLRVEYQRTPPSVVYIHHK